MSDKQSIINKIYYDRGGFGSKKITLDDSRKIDKSIKMSDIDKFLEIIQGKRNNLKVIIVLLHQRRIMNIKLI